MNETPGGGDPSAPATTSVPLPSLVVAEPPGVGRLLLGVLLAAGVGVVGAFVWEKIVFYAHVEIGWINIIIGLAIGAAMAAGSGRRGPLPAVLAAGVAFCAMMFGYLLLFDQSLAAGAEKANAPKPPMSYALFLECVKELSVIDWLFVAIGVYGAFKAPLADAKSVPAGEPQVRQP